ncbi:hypothetical protein PPYR_10114 [Photinus pyralis]|uniref:Rab-GAP TBC domain-containing protein n=1 Tax=Photinus pyralis TaxID=7054 RepID=A0A5N4AFE6_PHOPY|nr:TBC1 domain family member 14-like [Photinus pyralis]KAB0796053.1 hypothetical protein PPYR_10114 [Photinus pyralis]
MKNIDSDNESSLHTIYNGTEEVTDLLSAESTEALNLIKCNSDLVESYYVLKSTPMGHKNRFYQRVLSRNSEQDCHSRSMPNSLNNKLNCNDLDVANNCDMKSKLLIQQDSPPSSPSHEVWFKTWPERYDKVKPDNNCEIVNNHNTQLASSTCDKINCANNKVTLNEALQNISLAYSPVTKQLHLLRPSDTNEPQLPTTEENGIKTKHKRTEAGSFSSTVSSLSDPSPSGSLLDPEDRCTDDDSECKPQRKGISGFFNRNMFSWKLHHINSPNGWRLFNKNGSETSPQHQIVASSSALIQHIRPSNLPAKALEEDQRHREEYKAMVAAAKRKEAQNSAAKQKQHKLLIQQEEQLAAATKHFTQVVLPNWESMHNSRKTRDLWWQGLPSSVRGKIWRLAIGNDLNLTQQLYEICLQRAQNRLNNFPEPPSESVDQESSMDVIQLDISRIFPHLCIFQEGGPYSEVLHSLLAAYVCYRPDVGYVQGMSFIAAILILNMDDLDAFVCFANLLNRPLHLAAFTVNQNQMQAYYNAYNEVFNHNMPKLYAHFQKSGLTPDLYLLDWIYTIFAKAMPLDVTCRVWDIFLRDGDEFLFRTALGVLYLNQEQLMSMDFLHGAQFLTRLPDDLSPDRLFKSIQTVSTNVGKATFSQIVERFKN